jgi:hypothetical protein
VRVTIWMLATSSGRERMKPCAWPYKGSWGSSRLDAVTQRSLLVWPHEPLQPQEFVLGHGEQQGGVGACKTYHHVFGRGPGLPELSERHNVAHVAPVIFVVPEDKVVA